MHTCLNCGSPFEQRSTVQKYCTKKCREAVMYLARKAKREEERRLAAEVLQEETEEDRQLRDQRRRQDRMKTQIDWLDQRSRKPKGHPPMLKATAETPLGQLWLSLCYSDGQVNCLTRDSSVSIEDRERLLLAYFKLRLNSFAGDAVAKVCPVSLLNNDAEAHDLEDLSDTEHTHLETHDQERQRLQALLGL